MNDQDPTAQDRDDATPNMMLLNTSNLADSGSALEATRALVEASCKADVVRLVEPGTGVEALALLNPSGDITAVPSSIFDASRDVPKFRSGTATLFDLDSFIEHTNRFKDDDSIVFANNDRRSPSLTAVLDYHRDRNGARSQDGEADARFLRHKSTFAFPLSDEWKAWAAGNKQAMSMRDFAAFLEDHIIDVMPVQDLALNEDQTRFVETLGGLGRVASPAKLMELATGLAVYEESEASSAVKLASGEAKMTFTSRHVDAQGGELNVPSLFVLGIPVFVNGHAYQILVRLRYRKQGGELLFFYELWRTDRVFDHAFDEAYDKVKHDTGLPVLLGKPEGDR